MHSNQNKIKEFKPNELRTKTKNKDNSKEQQQQQQQPHIILFRIQWGAQLKPCTAFIISLY